MWKLRKTVSLLQSALQWISCRNTGWIQPRHCDEHRKVCWCTFTSIVQQIQSPHLHQQLIATGGWLLSTTWESNYKYTPTNIHFLSKFYRRFVWQYEHRDSSPLDFCFLFLMPTPENSLPRSFLQRSILEKSLTDVSTQTNKNIQDARFLHKVRFMPCASKPTCLSPSPPALQTTTFPFITRFMSRSAFWPKQVAVVVTRDSLGRWGPIKTSWLSGQDPVWLPCCRRQEKIYSRKKKWCNGRCKANPTPRTKASQVPSQTRVLFQEYWTKPNEFVKTPTHGMTFLGLGRSAQINAFADYEYFIAPLSKSLAKDRCDFWKW